MKKRIGVSMLLALVACVFYVFLIPPMEYDRTKAVPPKVVVIDNDFYDDPEIAKTWRDPYGVFSGLHRFNKVRVDYFTKRMNENEITSKANQIQSNRENDTTIKQKQSRRVYVDVGCGGGLVTEELGIKGFKIIGLDISPNSIKEARNHLNVTQQKLDKHVDVDYIVGSALDLPFSDSSIDGIVMSDVLEHLEDLPKLMQEMNRVVKPGGIFVFDTLNRNVVSYWLAIVFVEYIINIPPHAHDWRLFVKPEEMKQLLTENGFEFKEVMGVFPLFDVFGFLRGNLMLDSIYYSLLPSRTEVQYIGYAIKK